MRRISAMAMVALFGTAGVLWACDKEGKVVLAGAKVAPCCKAKFDKAVAGVMKTMPSMAYRVGETETHCLKSATAQAGKDGKVLFLVAGKAYDAETEAAVALADLLEKKIDNLQVVQLSVGGKGYGCHMSAKAALKDGEKMKYRLAGFDFATKEEAEKAQKIINCKLKGCDPDCIKNCVKSFPAKLTADGKKAGCNPDCKMGKGKATKVAAKGDKPCHQGKDAKAATVAAKDGSPCPHALGAGAALAGAKKGGCNKGKATTIAAKGDKPCCAKGNKAKAAKAATVAAKGDKPCHQGKEAKATTVAAKDGKKSGCKPGCKMGKGKAATVAAKGDKPCGPECVKPCCAKGDKPCHQGKDAKAATVAAKDGKPCCAKGDKAKAAKAATVAAKGDKPCHQGKDAKATTVAAKDGKKPGCKPDCKMGKAKATTVAAEGKGGCSKKAQQRLATVQDQIKLIVETAATLALSS